MINFNQFCLKYRKPHPMADQVVTVPILKKVLKETLKDTLRVFRADLIREIRDETQALIAASEWRLEQKIENSKK